MDGVSAAGGGYLAGSSTTRWKDRAASQSQIAPLRMGLQDTEMNLPAQRVFDAGSHLFFYYHVHDYSAADQQKRCQHREGDAADRRIRNDGFVGLLWRILVKRLLHRLYELVGRIR